MDSAPEIATIIEAWLRHFGAGKTAGNAAPLAPILREIGAPADPAVTIPALAALAAEALSRDRTLWIITADDAWLPDISNALDLQLRPLCLVLPGADYAGRIALRATLSLLKSRLTRAADDSAGPAWTTMRAHLQEHDALWRAALAWSTRGLQNEEPPAGIGTLFPVRIGPWAMAQQLDVTADWVMLAQSGQIPPDIRTAWPGARCTLMLAGSPISGSTSLAHSDATAGLRAELEVLGQELAEMELELATAQGELASFSERYHALIAERLAELDGLQAQLAIIRMQRTPDDPAIAGTARAAEARAEQSRRESENFRARRDDAEPARFSPSNDLKKRFRQLAQKIHPDRARDEGERAWRTQLMSEANRAYRNGDMAALDEVFALWLEGQEGTQTNGAAVSPAPTFADSKGKGDEALANQAAGIRHRLAAIAAELDRLYGSKLYELLAAARVATRQGRDLLQEMADRLDAQIEGARAALERLTATR